MIAIVALSATPSLATDPDPALSLAQKTVASKAYVDTKQDKIPATTSELYNISHAGSLVATTGSDGIVQERLIVPGFNALAGELGAILNQWNNLGGDNESLATMLTDLYLDYTGEDIAYNPLYSIPSLELISDLYNQMYYDFSTTLENATTGTPNNVAMYDNDGILADSRPTADAPTFDANGAPTNNTSIATIAAVNTRQKKMTCAGWDSETHTDEHCWLWSIE